MSVEDILEELNIDQPEEGIDQKAIAQSDKFSKEENAILSTIEKEPKHIDKIVRESQLDTAQVTSLLAMMEIKGKVKDLGDMVYFIT
jgi:DNA processing protein